LKNETEESDIPNLFNLRGSGILHIGGVPSYRIVGKATLHFGDIDDFEIYKLSGARDVEYQWDESQLAKAIRRNEPPPHYFPESKQGSIALGKVWRRGIRWRVCETSCFNRAGANPA
jgi:hypothetical protein